MPTCQECSAFRDGQCALNPVWVPVNAGHWCAQWRTAEHNPIGARTRKASEEQVYTAFCALDGAPFAIEYKEAVRQLVVAVEASRVTVAERLNRLVTRGLLEVFRRADDKKKIIRFVVDPEADKRGEVKPMPFPSKASDEAQEQEQERFGRYRKWHWPDIVAAMPIGQGLRFSEVSALFPKAGKGPLTRCLREAIQAGKVGQNEGGRYVRNE
jgi:hypothetical protein